MFATALGVQVIGIDLIPERLELAKQFGAIETIDATQDDPLTVIQDFTGGKGVNRGADYSGNPQAQETMLAAFEDVCICNIAGAVPGISKKGVDMQWLEPAEPFQAHQHGLPNPLSV